MIQVDNVTEDSVKCFEKGLIVTSPIQYSFPQRYKEAYRREMDAFLAMVQDPTLPHPVPKEDVLLSSRVADACERSLKEEKVVSLEQ